MLLKASSLTNTPVMSIQTGSELARLENPLIDPRDMTVLAYTLSGRLLVHETSLLLTNDIREVGRLGIIIDSADEIIAPDDVIEVKKVYDYNFNIENLPVRTESGSKVGKVIDFTLDAKGFTIQQLTVKRPPLKSLSETELLIGRSQIKEVSNAQITVSDSHEKSSPIEHISEKAYINPFRSNNPEPETIDSNS